MFPVRVLLWLHVLQLLPEMLLMSKSVMMHLWMGSLMMRFLLLRNCVAFVRMINNWFMMRCLMDKLIVG